MGKAHVVESKPPDRKRVGPYTIVERLGEGGMGVVYRGKTKHHEAAVKVIRESMLERDDIKTRFTREIGTLRSVDSPFVAKILDSDMSKKTAWMATEFVQGRSLKDLVDSDGPLDEQSWVNLAEGLLEGLAAIHEAGVIHQDVKPANIMMSPTGPKIIDFGISREIGSTRVTMTGMFAGSAGWMAPERAERDIETSASDVFSAGLVLAFAALGKHPWDGKTTQSDVAITLSMLSKPPDLDSLTIRQRDLIEGMLEMDAEKRPSTTRALGILAGSISPPNRPSKPQVKGGQKKRSLVSARATQLTFGGSAVSGALFAALTIAQASIGGFVVATGDLVSRATQSFEIASWLLGDAIGFALTPLGFEWILSEQAHSAATMGFRPLLFTAMIVYFVVRFSKRIAHTVGETRLANKVAHVALFSLPLLVVVTVSRMFFSEPMVIGGYTVAVEHWTALDVMFAAGILVLSSLFGLMLGRNETDTSTVSWVYLALKRGAPFFFIVLGGILVSLITYTFIAPNFLDSILFQNSSRPFLDYDLQDYVVVYLFVLAYLPALLLAFLSFILSGRAGVYLQSDHSLVLEGLMPGASSLDGFWQALIPGDFLFAGLFVVFLAITGALSGASVFNKTGFGPTSLRSMATIIALVVGCAVLLGLVGSSAVYLTSGSFDPTVFVHSSATQMLASLVLIGFCGFVFGASIIVGSRPVIWQFIVRSLPRTVLGIREFKGVTDRGTFVTPRIAGILVIALISLVFVAPVGVAAAERFLALTTTPEDIASGLADDLERLDPAQLKELFLARAESQLPWLPSPVIDDARPSPSANRDLQVLNSNGADWSLGELDALGRLQWVGDGGGASWDIAMEGSVDRLWKYVRRVSYTPDVQPVILALEQESIGEETSDLPGLLVNGVGVIPGKYFALPGTYRVERAGVGFLAPHKSSASPATGELTILVSLDFQVPDGAGVLLTRAIDEFQDACGSLSSSRCIDYSDIALQMAIESGSTPGSYYTATETGYIRGDVRCAAGSNQFIGLFEIAQVADCFQIVTSEKTFYDSRQIAEPVYSTRCARYGYSWYWGLYCARYERYQSGTNYQTVVGSQIGTVKYRGEVPFKIEGRANMAEDGTVEIMSTEVR